MPESIYLPIINRQVFLEKVYELFIRNWECNQTKGILEKWATRKVSEKLLKAIT
jgi:hypothetical protein